MARPRKSPATDAGETQVAEAPQTKSVEKKAAPAKRDVKKYIDLINRKKEQKNLRSGQVGDSIVFRLTKNRKPRKFTIKCKDTIHLPQPSTDPEFFEEYSFAYELTKEAQRQNKTGYDEKGNPIDADWIWGDNITIQYAEGEQSIYAMNQSEGKKRIKFFELTKGAASINTLKDKTLHRFLAICNHNKDFKYRSSSRAASIFHDNDRKNAEKELKRFNLEMEAESIVHNAPLGQILPMCLVYGVQVNEDDKTMRFNLIRHARKNPAEFIQWYNSPSTEVKGEYMLAKEYGVVTRVGDQIQIEGQTILVLPKNANEQDYVANFFMNEDNGRLYLEQIRRSLDSL